MENYHSLDIKSAFLKLKSGKNGLNAEDVIKRLQKNGPNEIPKEKAPGALAVFGRQFNNSLVYILLFAGILSLFLNSPVDAGVIFGAILINVLIGFFQENKAGQAIAKLRQLVEHKALVLRNGRECLIPSTELVIGDILLVRAGSQIGADARLIEVVDLEINESGLTGESAPVVKKIEPILTNASLADRENMVFAGTGAVRGVGRALVCATGKNTEIGKIAELVGSAPEERTPLQERLAGFGRILGGVFAFICFLIIIAGFKQGRPLLEMVETGVAVGVASIPEGLTVAVTFILALGMQEILRRKALVRKLVAAETLGSVTVICTDKTGTLTEGRMQVSHIVIGENEFEFAGAGQKEEEKSAAAVSLAMKIGLLCNSALIENPDDELSEWRFIGSGTETALLSAAIQSGLHKDDCLLAEPKIAELAFDSEKKYMLSLHRRSEDNNYVLYEKGAPEMLLEKSAEFLHNGEKKKITEKEKRKLIAVSEKLTGRGLRVIGVALREIGGDENMFSDSEGKIVWEKIDSALLFVGFIGIKDPLRKEAAGAIRQCVSAGIRPIMITGDHKLTAKAIAEEIGLKAKAENIISGEALEQMSDEKLFAVSATADVYARVSPHHKLRIVRALRARGEVVAMTGDGINDSPALKAADIGIALGTGTDIAKETADMVLLDDNFQTIVAAVRQGRIMFKNIRKVITFLVSDSFSEMILVIGSIMFNTPLAILPAQILWINIINDSLPHFSLAFEKDHGTVMQEKPIAKNEALINTQMKKIIFTVGIIRDALIFALFYILWQKNPSLENEAYLRTLFFAVLGVKSLMTIFSLRSFTTRIWKINHSDNPYLLFAVAASFVFLLMGIYWSPLQSILSTVDLGISGWIAAFGIGFVSIALIEIVKTDYIVPVKRIKAQR